MRDFSLVGPAQQGRVEFWYSFYHLGLKAIEKIANAQ